MCDLDCVRSAQFKLQGPGIGHHIKKENRLLPLADFQASRTLHSQIPSGAAHLKDLGKSVENVKWGRVGREIKSCLRLECSEGS